MDLQNFPEYQKMVKEKGKKCEAKEMKMKGETISSYELCPATSIVT
jgi:hypothetical protein